MSRQVFDAEIEMTGVFSLAAAVGSFLTLVVPLLCIVLGVRISTPVMMNLLNVYALLLVIALGTGFRSRHTRFGKWGFTVAALWMLFLVLAAGIILLVRR